jgi:uncharacterized protein (TIGR00255 family)
MKSMTGFGRAQSQTDELSLNITLKTVNSRFLEVRFHWPRHYGALETEVKKRLSQKLKRGTVDLSVARSGRMATSDPVFNQVLAEKWMTGFNQVAQAIGLNVKPSADILLQIPDFVQWQEPQEVSEEETQLLYAAIDQALEQVFATRKKEGQALQKGILQHISNLHKEVMEIQKIRQEIQPELKAKLLERLESVQGVSEVDPERLLVEVALQLDRGDISEEVLRLQSHIKSIQDLANKDTDSQGKLLDFYAQELLREVNTMGSKSGNASLTERIVLAKSHIEKYREQVQNIE